MNPKIFLEIFFVLCYLVWAFFFNLTGLFIYVIVVFLWFYEFYLIFICLFVLFYSVFFFLLVYLFSKERDSWKDGEIGRETLIKISCIKVISIKTKWKSQYQHPSLFLSKFVNVNFRICFPCNINFSQMALVLMRHFSLDVIHCMCLFML